MRIRRALEYACAEAGLSPPPPLDLSLPKKLLWFDHGTGLILFLPSGYANCLLSEFPLVTSPSCFTSLSCTPTLLLFTLLSLCVAFFSAVLPYYYPTWLCLLFPPFPSSSNCSPSPAGAHLLYMTHNTSFLLWEIHVHTYASCWVLLFYSFFFAGFAFPLFLLSLYLCMSPCQRASFLVSQ